jgi:hypothetical protein
LKEKLNIMNIDTKNVKKWMKKNKNQFIDSCNEVNLTALAEAAAEEFNLYIVDMDYMIPDEVFDLAVEAA